MIDAMKRASIFLGLAVAGFSIALGLHIASRLSAEETALLTGLLCGVGVAGPLGAALGAAIMAQRRRAAPDTTAPHPVWPPPVSAPPATLPLPRTASHQTPTPTGSRLVNIIGENGLDEE